MGKIIKYSDYEVNEGVRELMTPVTPEGIREKINDIISNPTGNCRSDVVNVLEKLKEKKVFPFLNEEEGKKIAQIALSDDKYVMSHIATGRAGNILWFMNRYGGGRFFINLDNGRISEIDGLCCGNAVKMLKEIL
jgi:hypothetical protein